MSEQPQDFLASKLLSELKAEPFKVEKYFN